jgi:hypothetical protein
MKASKSDNKEIQICGIITRKKFGEGSKSDHNAICIETNEDSFVLKRIGGNPFNDPVLNKMIGKEVTATGFLDQYQFLASDVQITGKD